MGKKPWNIGTPHSVKTKEKLSIAAKKQFLEKGHPMKGRKFTEEHRKNISKVQKGRKHSEESKKKVSVALIGIKRSDETKIKMSLAQRGLPHPKQLGEKNANWKGGITSLVEKIRKSLIYKLWHKDVLKKDNYTCQLCNKRGGVLTVDHYPKTFSDIFHENKITSLEESRHCEEMWSFNNGRALCFPCHRVTPTWGYKKEKSYAN